MKPEVGIWWRLTGGPLDGRLLDGGAQPPEMLPIIWDDGEYHLVERDGEVVYEWRPPRPARTVDGSPSVEPLRSG